MTRKPLVQWDTPLESAFFGDFAEYGVTDGHEVGTAPYIISKFLVCILRANHHKQLRNQSFLLSLASTQQITQNVLQNLRKRLKFFCPGMATLQRVLKKCGKSPLSKRRSTALAAQNSHASRSPYMPEMHKCAKLGPKVDRRLIRPPLTNEEKLVVKVGQRVLVMAQATEVLIEPLR
ncbi:hypothetical protein M514_09456 [Trichuris suis]|uniref:Uncharacterized protein n=1 Tax=Trichuris suis TaxID=68888 RepID=A0A085N9X7_9BILA|nr:hypothetical protein M514_09456 [Trichuris suis]